MSKHQRCISTGGGVRADHQYLRVRDLLIGPEQAAGPREVPEKVRPCAFQAEVGGSCVHLGRQRPAPEKHLCGSARGS